MSELLPKHKPENDDLSLYERIELLQDWISEDAEIKLRAANYCFRTELYDLTLPGYVSSHNEWMPRGDYLSDSARHARKQRKYWADSFSAVDMEKFQIYSKDYARFSVEELKQEIEELNNILRPT